MGRLIDTDEVLKCWNELSPRGRTEFDQVIMCMPTAYDVDKVVKQLKEEEEYSYADFYEYAEEHGLDRDDDWHYL